MRPVALALSLTLVAGLSDDSHAQCCGTPTVAFSPVLAAAPAPVVVQTTNDGWYPGKALGNLSRSLFGGTTTTTTVVAPTAGVATPTTAFRPVVMDPWGTTTAFRPIIADTWGATTAYRPTYPATWGSVAVSPVVQTVSRPVVLSPVVMSAPAVAPACDACGGVAQASFMSAPSSTCSSCSGGSSPSFVTPSSGYESSTLVEPAPALAPTENPPAIRTQRPEIDETDSILEEESKTPTDAASANEYWKAPPLFAPPANRVTQATHPAPVHTAVYRQTGENRSAAFKPAPAAGGKTHHLSADGWASGD